MLHTKLACDIGVQNVLVVSEDTGVIALLLAHVTLLNGQFFQKSESQTSQRILDIKHLQSGLSSNIAGLSLIERRIETA